MSSIVQDPPLRQRGVSLFAREFKEPLFRNGHALVISSMATAAIGVLFWVLAARFYSPSVVGRDSVAVSTLMFMGGVAQLNLASALIRFIPPAGRSVRRLVVCVYALSAAICAGLAIVFLLLVGHVVPSLAYLRTDRWLPMWWVLSSIAWAIFVLEDGALTGLRRAPIVPIENAGFSLLKAAIVIPFATIFPTTGIFVAWTLATIVTILPTNIYLFGRAIPIAHRRYPVGGVSVRQIARFTRYDFVGSIFWLVATSLLPLMVIREVGAAKSAAFSLTWVISYALYMVSINMGSSLVVESAVDQSQLELQCRRVMVHLAKLITPAVIVVLVGASEILKLFGHRYSADGANTLRLLALSALPFIVNGTAVGALRARRRMVPVVVLNAGICAAVVVISWLLLPRVGIIGVGFAWLITQCVAAATMWAARRLWLRPDYRFPGVRLWLTGLALPVIRLGANTSVPKVLIQLRSSRSTARLKAKLPDEVVAELTRSAKRGHRQLGEMKVLPSASDLTVAILHDTDGKPFAVAKVPRSERAGADLRCQESVLRVLASDDRLGTWRRLLPTFKLHEGDQQAFAIESVGRGVDAAGLLSATPSSLLKIARRSLKAIGDLHERTGREVVVDELLLEQLLEPSLRPLRRSHPSGCVPAAQLVATDRLEERLREASIGRTIPISWVHGDFTPGNVMLTPDAARVTTLLDWGQARPDGVPAFDVLLWVFALRCRTGGHQLGAEVRRVMESADWAGDPVLALASKALERTDIAAGDLALWCWLDHVAGNLRKSERYARHPLWWASNVEPVLRAVAA